MSSRAEYKDFSYKYADCAAWTLKVWATKTVRIYLQIQSDEKSEPVFCFSNAFYTIEMYALLQEITVALCGCKIQPETEKESSEHGRHYEKNCGNFPTL